MISIVGSKCVTEPGLLLAEPFSVSVSTSNVVVRISHEVAERRFLVYSLHPSRLSNNYCFTVLSICTITLHCILCLLVIIGW